MKLTFYYIIFALVSLYACKSYRLSNHQDSTEISREKLTFLTKKALFDIDSSHLEKLKRDSAKIYLARTYKLRESLLSEYPFGIRSTSYRQQLISVDGNESLYQFRGDQSDSIYLSKYNRYHDFEFDVEIPPAYSEVYHYFEPPLDVNSFCYNIWFYSPFLPTEHSNILYQQLLSLQLVNRECITILKFDNYYRLDENDNIVKVKQQIDPLTIYYPGPSESGEDECASRYRSSH